MIAYNITTKMLPHLEEQWLEWQTQEHIPEMMSTGMFDSCKKYRLLDEDDSEGITFAIQYFTSSRQRLQQYMDMFAAPLQKKAIEKWGHQCISFRTAMQLVD